MFSLKTKMLQMFTLVEFFIFQEDLKIRCSWNGEVDFIWFLKAAQLH